MCLITKGEVIFVHGISCIVSIMYYTCVYNSYLYLILISNLWLSSNNLNTIYYITKLLILMLVKCTKTHDHIFLFWFVVIFLYFQIIILC